MAKSYQGAYALGVLFAAIDIIWVALVKFNLAQKLCDWIMSIYFVNNPYIVQPFDSKTAVVSIFATFVFGVIVGFIIIELLNLVEK